VEYYKEKFNSVGWFIPPYVTMGYLGKIAGDISESNEQNLEQLLSKIYSPAHLAAMVLYRYPTVPHVSEYKAIIAESIDAHFLGLHHVSASGLIPAIEGIGRKILESKGLSEKFIKNVFSTLAEHCKDDVITRGIGAVSEIVAMLDSFVYFTKNNLYVTSSSYPNEDNTNRHGILHGAFSDLDYGTPINFYKALGAIEALCFIVSIDEPISFFAPDETVESNKLALKYVFLGQFNQLQIGG
jgi:hypothetical protein